jgi:transposase-like protein
MDPTTQFCPNSACSANGAVGAGNIGVHSLKEKRLKCHVCGKTFAATTGTVFYRLQYDAEVVSQVITLLSFGCPPIAIQMAYGLDERTIDSWREKAEAHSRQVHAHKVQQGRLDLGQVQGQ